MSPEPLPHSVIYELAAIWRLREHPRSIVTWICVPLSCARDPGARLALRESLNPETRDES